MVVVRPLMLLCAFCAAGGLQAQEAPANPVLVILSDAVATQVFLDGDPQGSAPLTLKGVAPGPHTITFVAPKLPPFHVPLLLGEGGRTEVNARVAVKRPSADFAQKKEHYDDAMFWIGLKGTAGLCGCGGGLAGIGAALTMLALPQLQNTAAPATAAIAGAVACAGGVSACGWSLLDIGAAPEEPLIPRVHVVKVTAPDAAASQLLELDAPPVDSDGEPLDEDDVAPTSESPPNDQPVESTSPRAVDVVYRY